MNGIETAGSPSPTDEMRELMRTIHESGYSNVDDLRQFIILYGRYIPHDGKTIDPFFKALDLPELELEFDEGTFDDIVEAYDNLGGEHVSIIFPDNGHIPESTWEEELASLLSILNDEEVTNTSSYALYIRQNAQNLQEADQDGTTYRSLISNPSFLHGLVKVYDFEQQETVEKRDLPSFWPDQDDQFLDEVLEAVGYHYAANFRRDWIHKVDGKSVEEVVYNLRAIAKLEKAQPGATHVLSKQYGIRNFGRYPIQLLVNQYLSGGEVDRPYGVIIGAVDDHNGALLGGFGWRNSHYTPSELYDQAFDTHDILVAEAETATEFEYRLKGFDKINGHRHKLDFAMIESHGSPRTLAFGREPNLGRLALGHKLHDMRKLFSNRASVLLTGCSTGRLNGIAQSLSRQLDTTIVAPNENASLLYLSFIPDPNAIRLVPVFSDQAQAIVHRKGSPLGTKKSQAYLDIRPADQ